MRKSWGLSLITMGSILLIIAFFWFIWAGKDLIDHDDLPSVQTISFKQNFSEVNNITIHGGLANTISITLENQSQITADITGHLGAIKAVRESKNFIIGTPQSNLSIQSCPWFKSCPPVSRLVSIDVIIPYDYTGNITIYGTAVDISIHSARMADNIKYISINTADSDVEITFLASDVFINTAKLDLNLQSVGQRFSVNSTSANIDFTPLENVSAQLNVSAGFTELYIHQMPIKGVSIESAGINTTLIEGDQEQRFFVSSLFEYDPEGSEHKLNISLNALYTILHIDKKITP